MQLQKHKVSLTHTHAKRRSHDAFLTCTSLRPALSIATCCASSFLCSYANWQRVNEDDNPANKFGMHQTASRTPPALLIYTYVWCRLMYKYLDLHQPEVEHPDANLLRISRCHYPLQLSWKCNKGGIVMACPFHWTKNNYSRPCLTATWLPAKC